MNLLTGNEWVTFLSLKKGTNLALNFLGTQELCEEIPNLGNFWLKKGPTLFFQVCSIALKFIISRLFNLFNRYLINARNVLYYSLFIFGPVMCYWIYRSTSTIVQRKNQIQIHSCFSNTSKDHYFPCDFEKI